MQNKIMIFLIISLFLISGCATRTEVDSDFVPDTTINVRVFSPDENKYVVSDVYVWRDDEFLDVYKSKGIEQIKIPAEIGDELKIVSLSEEYPYTDSIQTIKVSGVTNIELMVYKRSDDISMDCYYNNHREYQKEHNIVYPVKNNKIIANPYIATSINQQRLSYTSGGCYDDKFWDSYFDGGTSLTSRTDLSCTIKNNDENSRFYLEKIIVKSGEETNVHIDMSNRVSDEETRTRTYTYSEPANINKRTIITRVVYTDSDFDKNEITYTLQDEYPKILTLSNEDREKYDFIKDKIDINYPEFKFDVIRDRDLIWFEECDVRYNYKDCFNFCDSKKYSGSYEQIYLFSGDIVCCCYYGSYDSIKDDTIKEEDITCYENEKEVTGGKSKFIEHWKWLLSLTPEQLLKYIVYD